MTHRPSPNGHVPAAILTVDDPAVRDLRDGTSRDTQVVNDARRATADHARLTAQGIESRVSELRAVLLTAFATPYDAALELKLAEAQCLIAEWRAAIHRRQQP